MSARETCGAVTNVPHRGPVECSLPAGHGGIAHLCESIKRSWPKVIR